MPSKSKKQARFMRAVAHGWKPDRVDGPTRAVAREFVEADKGRKKFARGGYAVTEPRVMGKPTGRAAPPRAQGGALSQAAPPTSAGRILGRRPNPMVQTARQMPQRYGGQRFPHRGALSRRTF